VSDLRIAGSQCIGSGQPALPSDLLPLQGCDSVRCGDCRAKVAVWFANGQWTRRAHAVGIDTDELELAAMVRAGVRGGAISLDYGPRP
jgi:hypothetical protein